MNEVIEGKLDNIYATNMSFPNQILEIFNNFFGEDKVDMQGFPSIEEFKSWAENDNDIASLLDSDDISQYAYVVNRERIFNGGFILVHFPHVRITNEYDKFVDINHLYAKVKIAPNGTMNGRFSLNRAEYSYLHMRSGYMHSHVNIIPFHDFTDFQTPCVGTGPIRDTMCSLNREFDANIWELFCLELSKYVEVESIEGTPYHRLERLGTLDRSELNTDFTVFNTLPYLYHFSTDMVKDFTAYFINQKKLKFNYRDGSYSIGMSFTEYILTISNEFIDWYNDQFNKGVYNYPFNNLVSDNILSKCIISNGKLYITSSGYSPLSFKQYIGKRVCTFKGEDVLININDICEVNEENESLILNTRVALYILSKILYVINYRYGKSKQTDSEGNTISEEVRYF